MSGVYIIHTTADDATATRIHFALNCAGIGAWVDHVHGSERTDFLYQESAEALQDCEVGLFLLSPESAWKPKCQREWESVLRQGKPLIIAIASEIAPDDIPDRLWDHTIPSIDLTCDVEDGITHLLEAIAGAISS